MNVCRTRVVVDACPVPHCQLHHDSLAWPPACASLSRLELATPALTELLCQYCPDFVLASLSLQAQAAARAHSSPPESLGQAREWSRDPEAPVRARGSARLGAGVAAPSLTPTPSDAAGDTDATGDAPSAASSFGVAAAAHSEEVRVLQWRVQALTERLAQPGLTPATTHGVRRQLAVQTALLARELRRLGQGGSSAEGTAASAAAPP